MSGTWGEGDDLALVTAASRGDGEAFARVYDRHAGWVYSRLRYDLVNEAEARDATQEVFLEVWRDLPQLRDPQAFPAWVRTVTARRAMKVTRARAARPDTSAGGDDQLDRAVDPASGPDVDAIQGEARQLVADGLEGLNPRYRQVVELRLLHGQAGGALIRDLGMTAAQASRLADKALHGLADSIRALVVARQGRRSCAGLDRLLAESGWVSGPLTPELRSKVQRHVGRCTTCQGQRQEADRQVLESLPMLVPFVVPAGLRDSVLHEAARIAATRPAASQPPAGQEPSGPASGQPASGPRWVPTPAAPTALHPAGGSPSPDRGLRVAVGGAAAVLVLLLGVAGLRSCGDDDPSGTADSALPDRESPSDDAVGPKGDEPAEGDDGDDGVGGGASGCVSAPPDNQLDVTDQGFGVVDVDGTVNGSYGFVVENTTGADITDLSYSVEFYNDECQALSGIVDTVVNDREVIRPGQEIVVGHEFYVPAVQLTVEDFADVEMVVVAWPNDSLDRGPAPDGEVTVRGITSEAAGGEVTTSFTVSSSYATNLQSLTVYLVYLDAQGGIVGGGHNFFVGADFTDDFVVVPAGGSAPLSITTSDAVADPSALASTEVSAVADYANIT